MSVVWERKTGAVVRYDCEGLSRGSRIGFSVAFFSVPADGAGANNLVVDVQPLGGCRAGFQDLYVALAAKLMYHPGVAAPARRRSLEPPPMPAAAFVPASASVSASPSLAAVDHMVEKSAARAVEFLATKPESAELFFADRRVTPLAEAVAKAAQQEDDDGLTIQLSAVSTIANLASHRVEVMNDSSACSAWLSSLLPTLEETLASECPHIRRESARALAAMTTHSRSLAVEVMRKGLLDVLEMEATPGSENGTGCFDVGMMTLAHSALVACRS